VSEIDYAEYVNDGLGGDQFAIPLAPSQQDWPGLSISVPPQSTPFQLELFVPVVQSTTDNSIVYFQLVEAPWLQRGLITCQSLPNNGTRQEQTFGPLIYTRRFPPFSGVARQFKVRYVCTGSVWIAMLDAAGPNVAYLRADTV
jgi:hypothetical protein